MHRLIIILLFVFLAFARVDAVFAQTADQHVKIKNNMMQISFDDRKPQLSEELGKNFGINVDSLFEYNDLGSMADDGWIILKRKKHIVVVAKTLDEPDLFDWSFEPLFFEEIAKGVPGTPGYPSDDYYGVNQFKREPSVYKNEDGNTVFNLKGYTEAKHVYLSGNFNTWSTLNNPMEKTDSGWTITLPLEPGKYLYKFIVDGYWTEDPENELQEWDGQEGKNSAYYNTNYVFELDGFANARKVVLAASFNFWNENELKMSLENGVWKLPIYVREGTHAYKFIVDGEWMLDPVNPLIRPDGTGNFNSYFSIGDTSLFELKGFSEAQQVMVAGNFNVWNSAELSMTKTSTGWELPYVLAPGNYEYKFIVDGNWITDPANPLTIGEEDYKNSLLVVDPNYTFSLDSFPEAKNVSLSGSFNGWSETGFPMAKENGKWTISLHLKPGKYSYKFIVDGNWIHDPANEQKEPNEYGEFNSFIWLEQESTPINQ